MLFEFKASRRELCLIRSTICYDIEKSLAEFGVKNACVSLGGERYEGDKVTYLLQRWNSEWGCYVDVQRVTELRDMDKVTVVTLPADSPTKVYFLIR